MRSLCREIHLHAVASDDARLRLLVLRRLRLGKRLRRDELQFQGGTGGEGDTFPGQSVGTATAQAVDAATGSGAVHVREDIEPAAGVDCRRSSPGRLAIAGSSGRCLAGGVSLRCAEFRKGVAEDFCKLGRTPTPTLPLSTGGGGKGRVPQKTIAAPFRGGASDSKLTYMIYMT